MRILIVSDSHGRIAPALHKARELGELSLLLHLGDHGEDGEQMAQALKIPCCCIQGNCDLGSGLPEEMRLPLPGNGWLMACHGHRYGVKYTLDRLFYRAMEQDVKVALFGHTHRRYLQWEGGILLLNPGSCAQPADGECSMALLDVDRDHFEAHHIFLEEIPDGK